MIKLYIGMDVHKEKTVIALAPAGSQEVEHYGNCSSDIVRLAGSIRKVLSKYHLSKDEVSICYEAGPRTRCELVAQQ